MAVISRTDYLSIVTDYTSAQTALTGVSTNYYDAAYTVLIVNVFDPEIDLLIAFHNAYVVSQSAYSSAPSSAVNAVGALQNHVLSQQLSEGNQTPPIAAGLNYDNINDFYEDFPADFLATIPQDFADLSGQAGHSIDAAHIAP